MLSSRLLVAAVVTCVLPLLATATPHEARGTAPIQCCASTSKASDPATSALLKLLGVVVQGVDVPIGVNCSPITVVGVGAGSGCSGETVSCEDNSFGGLVAVGCVPVSV